MIVNFKVETNNVSQLEELNDLVTILIHQAGGEEEDQFDKPFNDWAKGFFNPKHKENRYGKAVDKTEIIENFNSVFDFKGSPQKIFRALKKWTMCSGRSFLEIDKNTIVVETYLEEKILNQ